MKEIRFETEKDLNGSMIIKIAIPKVVLITEELENIKKELLFKFASLLIKGFEKVKGGGMLGDTVVEKEI